MSARVAKRLILLAALSVAALVVAPFVGMHVMSPLEVLRAEFERRVFFQLRVPRVLVGYLAGGGLAVCGMVFQAVFRNPLADPYTLGIASGASFGASLAILFGGAVGLAGLPATSAGAFAGAMLAMAIVYGFTRIPRIASGLSVLLVGVAISFMFSSFLMFAQFMSDQRHSFAIVRWLMGGLEVYGYGNVLMMLPLYLAGLVVVGLKLPELDHLLTGEDLAATRGVDVARTKVALFTATSLTVSAVVSLCGPVGFVGLMAPHICRLFFANDHRVLAPASFLFGGAFLVICDAAARTIIAPTEIPVGVITALCGGPFFLWLLLARVRRGGEVFR